MGTAPDHGDVPLERPTPAHRRRRQGWGEGFWATSLIASDDRSHFRRREAPEDELCRSCTP